MNTRWRTISVILLGLTSALGLSGCGPGFTTPIEWIGGYRYIDNADEAPVPVDILVRLDESGIASLVNFPQGTTHESADGSLCLSVSGVEAYTGSATWSDRNGFTIDLIFADSEVVVSAGEARFAQKDWTVLRFVECDTGTYWNLILGCGDPDGGRSDCSSLEGPAKEGG